MLIKANLARYMQTIMTKWGTLVCIPQNHSGTKHTLAFAKGPRPPARTHIHKH